MPVAAARETDLSAKPPAPLRTDGAGRVFFEDCALSDLADVYGTPSWVYSTALLKDAFETCRQHTKTINAEIRYSVKANGHIALLRLLRQWGAGADIVSLGELKRARYAGIEPAEIVFSGVGKTDEELTVALQEQIGQINIESVDELSRIQRLAVRLGVKAPLAVRVNPDVDAETDGKIATGRRGDKFGIALDGVEAVFAEAAKMDAVRLQGLAVHIGSQLRSLAPCGAAFAKLKTLTESLRRAGYRIDTLDLGGGLGITDADRRHTAPSWQAYVGCVRTHLGPEILDGNTRILIEPGRRLVASAGILLAKVVTVKTVGEHEIAILDAGMNDLLRPALYNAEHPVRCVSATSDGPVLEAKPYTLAGPICESADVFARKVLLPPLAPGDLLAFLDAGAYGAVMSSQYNSRPLAAEILVSGKRHAAIRRREAWDAFKTHETLPPWDNDDAATEKTMEKHK